MELFMVVKIFKSIENKGYKVKIWVIDDDISIIYKVRLEVNVDI